MTYPYQWEIEEVRWGQIGRLKEECRNNIKAGDVETCQIKNEPKGYWPFTINAEDKGLAKTEIFEFKHWMFKAGEKSHEAKVQRTATEYDFIIEGRIRAKVRIVKDGQFEDKEFSLKAGDYVIIKPGFINNLEKEVIEDVRGVTIKIPSVKDDTIKESYFKDF
jgi:mannose-6-phosphate isomerase-like protein (cupin superfamily)